ncbi:unnamed protein product [Ilex paraguariensis]|uniref:HMA domain-containing protein n=1 Tax=Ilex paraguariensis TaxID=185542 RepID=A0ABC8TBU0_9AQUA
MEPVANVTCLLKVNVHCEACKMKMMEVMGSITGVYSVTIEAQEGTAKVCGEVDPNILLRALARSGRHAELVWVKLKHPSLSRCNYENGYGSNGSYGYGALEEPYRYGRALPLPEHSSYNTHQHCPMRRAVMEGPTYSTSLRYGYSPSPPARYVPGYPPAVYDPYEEETINFCCVM